MLRRDEYLLRGSAEVGEEDDLVSFGIEEALYVETPGRMFYGKPKSIQRIVMGNYGSK